MNSRNSIMWILITGILVASAAILIFLDQKGRHARTYANSGYALSKAGLPVSVVETSGELYNLYKSKKVKGRILLHFGKYLHAVNVETDGLIPAGGEYPVAVKDMLPLFESKISYRNVFWVSMQGNIAREIYYVEPPAVFSKRMRDVSEKDVDVISKKSGALVVHNWGERMTISERLPKIPEPVLLNIDASIFEELQPEELLQIMQGSSVAADIVTLNMSRDNPDITDSSRSKLLAFAKILTEGKLR